MRTCYVLRACAYCSGDVHRTPKAKGALAGCVITAVLGMLSVVWVRQWLLASLTQGSTTDCFPFITGTVRDRRATHAEELEEEVERDMAQKAAKGGGYKKRAFNAVFRRNQPAAA